MVGVPMPESESFSCSDPKVPDAQIRNSEVIKHTGRPAGAVHAARRSGASQAASGREARDLPAEMHMARFARAKDTQSMQEFFPVPL